MRIFMMMDSFDSLDQEKVVYKSPSGNLYVVDLTDHPSFSFVGVY